ncbi:hypothetical protein C8R47DRAFT_1060753 [Mycena vitilis]|nr:hypothetical protein C8R47DRAFT_1060753 [Mycena vitilis]
MPTMATLPLVDPAEKAHIRELLRSHLPPPAHLSSTVSAIAAELARRDTEITTLRERLDQLFVERAAIQAHYTDCNSIFAPVRKLPSEILVEIFGLCWDSFTPSIEDVYNESVSLPTETARLAHAPLLNLSQVCVRWHTIALGTPALWSRIELEGILWTAAPHHIEHIMGLLRSALQRSANHPLGIAISNCVSDGGGSPYLPAFELLAQHSTRWQTAAFMCPFSDLLDLNMSKSMLPHLKSLQLDCWGANSVPGLDIFQDVPQLRSLEFRGDSDSRALLSRVPLEQLTELRYLGSLGREEPEFMALVPRLTAGTTLRLMLSLQRRVVPSISSFLTSNISTLILQLSEFVPVIARRTLERFFNHLTLPFLTELTFDMPLGVPFPSIPVLWSHLPFLSLAERSSFRTNLHTLYLANVFVTEAELLQCLSVLPALNRLSIADHPHLQGSPEQVLVTDTLLTALACTPERPSLVPDLHFCYFRCMLRFDDSVFSTCLLSRVQGLSDPPFDCGLFWLPGHARELDSEVYTRLCESSAAGGLLFRFQDSTL